MKSKDLNDDNEQPLEISNFKDPLPESLGTQAVAKVKKDEAFDPPQIYNKSFIQTRNSKDGKTIGPEALFGKFYLILSCF